MAKTTCPKCNGRGELPLFSPTEVCDTCTGEGALILTPWTFWKLPLVEVLEVGKHYVNQNNVYIYGRVQVDTYEGPKVIVEDAYRPCSRENFLKALSAEYGEPVTEWKSFTGPKQPWTGARLEPLERFQKSPTSYNKYWEIPEEAFLEAFANPKLWQ